MILLLPLLDQLFAQLFEPAFVCLANLSLALAIDAVAVHKLCVVHLMTVEIGSVDAGELHLAADRHAAAAAHAGAVDHDGVERDDGLDAKGFCGFGDELHHRNRTDGEDLVVLRARFEQLLQLHGNKAVLAVAAIVGHEIQMVAGLLKLVFQNDDVLVAEADDDVDLDACFLECLCRRIRNRAADAAADHTDTLFALHVGGLAKGTDEVLDIVALVQLPSSSVDRPTFWKMIATVPFSRS